MSVLPSEHDVLEFFDTLTNSGRWGETDELGTINLVTPEKRREAVGLVRRGTSVSCAAPIQKGQIAPDVPYPPLHFMIRSGESAAMLRPGTVDYIGLVFHGLTTTHVDALAHSTWEGRLYGGRSRSVVTTELGATELSVDVLRDGVITRGVLLDIAGLRGRPYLEPGEPILPADLEAAETAAGARLGPGDALLVRTGWWLHRREHGPAPGRSRPGLHAACLPWLRQRDVAIVATDAANDVIPSGYSSIEQPIHEVGQVAMGMCLIDVCDFDRLLEACRAEGRYEVAFVVAPLRDRLWDGVSSQSDRAALMALETGLRGKRALVTGGGTGIGLAIARALAGEGVDLAIASRSARPRSIAAHRAAGIHAEHIEVDLADESAATRLIERAVAALGGLDLLVSNAALARHEPMADASTAAWTATLTVNLMSAMWLCRAAATHFMAQASGSILIVGSTAAYHRAYGQGAYHVSKAALMAFATTLAVELGPHGIRVNTLVPGRFPSALNRRASPASVEEIPLGRVGRTNECGPAAVFLLSDALSSYVTGAELVVSGGLHLRPMPRYG